MLLFKLYFFTISVTFRSNRSESKIFYHLNFVKKMIIVHSFNISLVFWVNEFTCVCVHPFSHQFTVEWMTQLDMIDSFSVSHIEGKRGQ